MPSNITIQYKNNTNYEPLYPAINNSLIEISATQITSGILSPSHGGTGVTSINLLELGANQITSGVLPLSHGGTGVTNLVSLKELLNINNTNYKFAMGETTAEEVTLTGFKSVITALVCLNKKNDYATQSIPHVKSLTKTRLGIGWIRPGNS